MGRTLHIELAVALLVADGISRHRVYETLNTSGVREDWSLLDYQKQPDFKSQLLSGGAALFKPNGTELTPLHAKIIIQGLSYQARLVTDYLAIAVLLIYIIVAIAHVLYLIWTRQSSSQWDFITEFFVLAYNSKPISKALENTSSGINCIKTFGNAAIVRGIDSSSPSSRGIPIKRVQIMFQEDHRPNTADEPLLSRDWEDGPRLGSSVSTWPLSASDVGKSTYIELSHLNHSCDNSHSTLSLNEHRSPASSINCRRMEQDKMWKLEVDELYK